MDAFDKYPDLNSPEFIEHYDFTTCWTVVNKDAAFSELDVCVALIKFDANYTEMSKVLQRSRRTLETFVARDPMISNLAQDVGEMFLDQIEEKYRGMALAGDGTAAKFFLSTKGKNRGYTTRTEMVGKDDGPIDLTISPREELRGKISTIRDRLLGRTSK